MQAFDFKLGAAEHRRHKAQHVVVVEGEDLILEGNRAAIDVVRGNSVVAEHQPQRPAIAAAQRFAIHRIGDLAFLHHRPAQPRQLAVLYKLPHRTAGIHPAPILRNKLPNRSLVKHGWCSLISQSQNRASP